MGLEEQLLSIFYFLADIILSQLTTMPYTSYLTSHYTKPSNTKTKPKKKKKKNYTNIKWKHYNNNWSCQTSPHIPGSCIMQEASNPNNTTKFRGPDGAIETVEDSGKVPDGGKAESGPGATVTSGFGGLWLEGIVGTDDSDGGTASPPGEGNSGEMSGDRAGEYTGAPGKTAGAAEIVETLIFNSDAKANEE